MYEKFLKYVSEEPELYAPSTSAFWDDENISKYMLEAHLNPDMDAASRKPEVICKTVDWVASVAPPAAFPKLLDLGCGPGLYAERFSKAGYQVTGIDISHRSIAYAKARAEESGSGVTYRLDSYLNLKDEACYDAAVIIYCDFGVLSPADRLLLMRNVKRALKPGGLFLLDGWHKRYFDEFKEETVTEYQTSGFWSAEPHLCITTRKRLPETKNYLDKYIVVTANDCQCYYIWNQIFSSESLTRELEAGGFHSPRFYDDFCGAPFTGTARTICAVAEA